MAISPILVGDRSEIDCTLETTSGGIYPLSNISTSQISMYYVDSSNGALHIGQGFWTITDAPNGKASWFPAAADVAAPGLFRLYPVIQLVTGPKAFLPLMQDICTLL